MRNIKKVWLMVSAVSITLGLSSCEKTISTKGADASLDSLAMARGYVNGRQLTDQVDFMTMMGQNVNKEQVLKGMQEGMANSSDSTKMWYYQGLIMGYQMAQSNDADKVNNQIFLDYFLAGFKKDSTKMNWSMQEMQEYLSSAEQALQEKKQIEQEKALKEQYKQNIEDGAKYLEDFKKGEGVVVLPSGVAYKVLKAGTGKEKPTSQDTVEVFYIGRHTNGEVFDKSGETPVTFGVTGVIKGWTEVLQEMTVGEKVEVVIPYESAYGTAGSGQDIKPYETLVFEVELVSIKKAEEKK